MEQTCQHIQELMPQLMEGTLSGEQTAEAQSHITQCPPCSEYLQALQSDDRLLTDFAQAMQPAVSRIEDEVTDVLNRRPSRKPLRRSSVWATITKRPIPKLAVAAVIIISILVGIHRFGGSVDGASVAFAQVTRTVRNVPWMHISYGGHWVKETGYDKSDDERLRLEIWCSFVSQILIHKYADGVITYADYSNQEIHTYNPVSNRIVISGLSHRELPLEASTPWGWFQKDIQRMRKRGALVVRRIGEYDGKQVEVYEIGQSATGDMEGIKGQMLVDVETRLPIAKEMRYFHPEGKFRRVVKGTFEYPEDGPADIYDLGVPRDTELVNSLPLPPWEEIKGKYRSYREDGPGRFIAVVTHLLPSLSYAPIEVVDVSYKDGKRWRKERHHVFRPGPVRAQWQKCGPELGNTFDSLLKWAQGYKGGSVQGDLYDGNYLCSFARGVEESWQVEEKVRVKAERMTGWGSDIRDLGWPDIRGAADVVQDDYARENNLIRVEVQERQFYLDPSRDYICQRQEINGEITEVTEFAETEAGRWYPKKVESRLSSKTIYLETAPKFPEGIFDLENLPK